ncbi:MAG: response regulator transcription factor [Dehalococcoidia bacterium]|nr:response regulator transcription factor [Dehalococcoidia bacterium]
MSENARSGESGVRLRVMLCHDVPVMRGGLRSIINAERDMEVVAEADGITQAVDLIDEARPEVIVTDLCMDNGSGLDGMRSVKNVAPWLHILVLAGQGSGDLFPMAMRAGADGYLMRDAEPTEVVNAIRCVSKGHNYVNASIVTLLVSTYVCKTRRADLRDSYDLLSDRERETLCLAAAGHTNREIADILRLSERTIHNVRARLMEKLGFHDRLELLKYALRRGIISAGDM